MLLNGQMLIIQMIGVIGFGGLVGEVVRTFRPGGEVLTPSIYAIHILGSSFLSFFIAALIYSISQRRDITLISCGILGYQELEILERISLEKLLDVLGIEKGEK